MKGKRDRDMLRLSRREILEELVRQGVQVLSRIKAECRRFEHHWLSREAGLDS